MENADTPRKLLLRPQTTSTAVLGSKQRTEGSPDQKRNQGQISSVAKYLSQKSCSNGLAYQPAGSGGQPMPTGRRGASG